MYVCICLYIFMYAYGYIIYVTCTLCEVVQKILDLGFLTSRLIEGRGDILP